MNKSELKKLRKKLPFNYLKRLAESTELSESSVWKVLHNIRNNKEVIQAALKLAEEHQKEQADIKEQIKSL